MLPMGITNWDLCPSHPTEILVIQMAKKDGSEGIKTPVSGPVWIINLLVFIYRLIDKIASEYIVSII